MSRAAIRPRSLKWRKLRDPGVLEGKQPGEKIGKLTPEQAEIARLKRKLELTHQRLARQEQVLRLLHDDRYLLPLDRRLRGSCVRVRGVSGRDDDGNFRASRDTTGCSSRSRHIDDEQNRRRTAIRFINHQIALLVRGLER